MQELIKKCKQQNLHAQAEVYQLFSGKLFALSLKYSRNKQDAEDVLQDAFIRIFGAIEQFDSNKGSLEGWMRKIVINTALKRLNKRCFTHEKTVDQFQDIQLHPMYTATCRQKI